MDFRSQLTQNGVPVALAGHTHAFGDLTGRPTTLAGYGITDAPTKTGGGASGTWPITISGAAASLSGTYRADTWIRTVNDAAQVKLYGNSRTMNFRTDGQTNPISAQGNYPFIFTYGGDGAGNRMFMIASDGRLWSAYHGWLDTASVGYASSAGNAATTTQTTFSQVYTDGWFRTNSQNLGLYSQYYGNHFYAESAQRWTIASGSSYPSLCFRTGHQGTVRGYIYSDASGFGLLHSGGGWMLYANGNDNVIFPGTVTADYVTTTKNAQGGYAFYDRTVTRLWSIYAQDNIFRLWSSSDLFTVSLGGNVGIRQPIWSGCALSVTGMGTTDSTYGLIVYNSGGLNSFYVKDNGTAWARAGQLQSSDARRKAQIADIDDGLALICALRPRAFVMRDDPRATRRYGVIAQEAATVVPNLVDLSVNPGQQEAEYSFDYTGLIGPLIGAVQELAARVITLEDLCSR